MPQTYPVIEERTLPAVPGRMLRRSVRPLTDLPDRGPGRALVLRVGGQFVELDEREHLSGAEQALVAATSVTVVDTRARAFTVELNVPSASAADTFDIHVVFHSQVIHPETAAAHGVIDLAGSLRRHLRRDRKLLEIGSSFEVEQISEVRELVEARIEAYYELMPYEVSGLAITLSAAEVLTPAELREYSVGIRDEVRDQQLASLRNRGEDANIQRMRNLVDGGSKSLTALDLARGGSVANAVREAREDESEAREHLRAAITMLQNNQQLDFVRIDAQGLVDSFVEQITGRRPAPLSTAPLGGGSAHSALGAGWREEVSDEIPPDEDDLAD